MFSVVISGAVLGLQSFLVHVEVDLSRGLPCFVMVGRLGGEVRESAERVRIALKNIGISIPPMHIAVNLSPADLRKEGTGFDLPVAVALLTAMGKLPPDCKEGLLILGELGLNGEIKPVKGVLPVALGAVRSGITHCLVAKENAAEAMAAPGMRAAGVEDLRQALLYLQMEEKERKSFYMEGTELLKEQKSEEKEPDFAEVIGQESAKRAALIAAAGFHHMLIMGPPGAGKTMIARRIPTILPPLSKEESLEVSSLYSIAGMLKTGNPIMTRRPFMSPHHTISPQALAGGGRIPQPGVISLSHRGILFLDELPEFKRQTLDLLRQPLEDKEIHLARSTGSFTYPASVMMVAAMNPCPCGYFPDTNRCTCTPGEIHQYLSHISGPILDRIDLCVEMSGVEIRQLQTGQKGESSESMRRRVLAARSRQQKRYEGTGCRFNSDLGAGELEKYCPLGTEEKQMLERLSQTMELSARAYHRLVKVARTIADLEQSERITAAHLAEAVCYRGMDRVRR